MEREVKTCQNCKKEFVIYPELANFCASIKVPTPTFCPDCNHQQREMFRNERALYRRPESLNGENVISIYSADKDLTVYKQEYWRGDGWDPLDYGKDYDFSRPFFEQLRDLMKAVPEPAITNWNATNSEYCSNTTDNKNCYLVFGGDFNEDCSYGYMNFHSRDSMDLYWVDKLELAYECTDTDNSFRVAFCQNTLNSTDSMFLYDCVNCNHCLGCVGLRNKQYHIWNQPYSKEEYEKEIAEINLSSFSGLQLASAKFKELKNGSPRKYADIFKSVNCTGNYLQEGKNSRNCYECYSGSENCGDLFLAGWNIKDSYNSDHVGYGSELIYNSHIIFSQAHRVFFSALSPTSHDVQYCYNINTCSNCFGCVGIKNKSYCIFNKEYSKEDYERLVPKIIEHMNAMPYVDKVGRVYKYGEFFPPDFSFFAYNESKAQEFYPLSKEEALQMGFAWKDAEEKSYSVDIRPSELPDDIKDVADDILSRNIGCAHEGKCNQQCTTAFRIIPSELSLYRRLNLPLPRLCSNCRHYERMIQRNPMKTWHRACMCDKSNHGHQEKCSVEFETPYAPARPEIVYCEQCYNSEVV